jgi:hypothetical protein
MPVSPLPAADDMKSLGEIISLKSDMSLKDNFRLYFSLFFLLRLPPLPMPPQSPHNFFPIIFHRSWIGKLFYASQHV